MNGRFLAHEFDSPDLITDLNSFRVWMIKVCLTIFFNDLIIIINNWFCN